MSVDQSPAPTAPATQPASEPKRKWHDTKWKLIAACVLGGLLLGVSMASGDRTAAKEESKRIVADAKERRADILGDAGKEKDTLTEDVETLRDEKAALSKQVAALQKELGMLKRTKATSTFEGSGIYMVGSDIKPGTYRAAASPGCYYAVLRALDGSLDNIIANGNVDGPVVIEVPSSAKGVEVQRCSTFTRVPG